MKTPLHHTLFPNSSIGLSWPSLILAGYIFLLSLLISLSLSSIYQHHFIQNLFSLGLLKNIIIASIISFIIIAKDQFISYNVRIISNSILCAGMALLSIVYSAELLNYMFREM